MYPVQGKLTALANVHQIPEASGNDPVLPFGNRRRLTAITPTTSIQTLAPPFPAGQSSKWFFGESLQPASATLLSHAESRTARSCGSASYPA